MSMTAVMLAPQVLIALAFFMLAGLSEPLLEYRLNRLFEGNHAFHWSWEHVLAPGLRAAVIAGFVLLAYPALFGVRVAPPLAILLDEGAVRLNTLIGVLFVCTLLLPLTQLFARRSMLLLPLQGLIATAIVFGWYADYLGATASSVWPGFGAAMLLAGIIVFGHRLAAALARHLGHALDAWLNTSGADRLVMNSAELFAQAPVILLYGYALGQQVSI